MSLNKRKICVVTGTRAEYGLLYWLMKEIQDDPELELQIIATGMHLSPEFGLTYKVIEEDGFRINAKVEMLLSSDTPVGVAKSIGLGTIGFADTLERLNPDLLVLPGDRFEMLSAAQAALIIKLPIAHLFGGDTTEGAFDEAIRHSITKMAHLHFVTNILSCNRVCQMGENPDHVFNVGNPGLDYIRKAKLLKKAEIENKLGFSFQDKNLLITFHPVTLENENSVVLFQKLLSALETIPKNYGLIFTLPNADTEGRALADMTKKFVAKNPNTIAHNSLGQLLFLSTMAQVDAVAGNSSSGIYEAPSFKIPTVNIGDRQKGRLKASSVIDCNYEKAAILKAINEALNNDYSEVHNPYGDGHSSEKIIMVIKSIDNYKSLLKKVFFEV
jgi:UDP-hydrolysing UDP-N-acetyl-D-glucosamine 2-epimerase